MNWLDRLLGRKAQALTELPSFLMGPDSKTGIPVSWSTALQVATVFACARALAEGVAQVPFKVYQHRPDGLGADERPKHDLYRLVYRRPNPWQTSFEFRETLMLHLVLCGNAYVFKNVVGSGRITELIPLQPGQVAVTRRADLSLWSTTSPSRTAAPARSRPSSSGT
jgi:HK97 family phage portal protein